MTSYLSLEDLLTLAVRHHALVDGNKRLGWLATVVFYGLNDVSEEVHCVPVEVAAGAVAVLGRSGVCVAGEVCAQRRGAPASSALVAAACRSEWGLTCLGMPAVFAILMTHAVRVAPVDRSARQGPQDHRTLGRARRGGPSARGGLGR